MKGLLFALPVLAIPSMICAALSGCNNTPQNAAQAGDVNSQHDVTDTLLARFKTVTDTISNEKNGANVHTEYFLHDITGDGQPELWVISGTCEADKELWVYQAGDGYVKKILSTDGGHAEFYVDDDFLACLECNTGYGYVYVFTYDNDEIKMDSVEYDGNKEESLLITRCERDSIIADRWENCDSIIPLLPLK